MVLVLFPYFLLNVFILGINFAFFYLSAVSLHRDRIHTETTAYTSAGDGSFKTFKI